MIDFLRFLSAFAAGLCLGMFIMVVRNLWTKDRCADCVLYPDQHPREILVGFAYLADRYRAWRAWGRERRHRVQRATLMAVGGVVRRG